MPAALAVMVTEPCATPETARAALYAPAKNVTDVATVATVGSLELSVTFKLRGKEPSTRQV